jgi:SNF2 family DNA or RNA helicase
MQRVQILLKSIMLRRQKDSVVDGQVVCTIPPKHTNREDVTFSEEEQELYKALETKSQLTFNKYLEKGTVSGEFRLTVCPPHSMSKANPYLSQLRKCPCPSTATASSLLPPASHQRPQPACYRRHS